MTNDFQLVELEDAGLSAHLARKISYGESRALDAALFNATESKADQTGKADVTVKGALVLDWTMQKILTVCKKLVAKDGAEKPVNLETIEALTQSDGQALEMAVEKILTGIKKK